MPIVSFSRLENVVAGYFTLKGYIVVTNTPLKTPSGRWSDIDVIALNSEEICIAECKRGALDKDEAEKLVEHYNLAVNYLQETSPYKELIEKLKLKIRKLYVAEYVRKAEKILEKEGIEVRKAKDILCEIIQEVKKQISIRKTEGAYPNQFLRYIILLSKENLLKNCKT